MKPSGETKSQTLLGNTEKQGQNTPNIDTSVDNPTHVVGKEYNTSNEPNVSHKDETSKSCKSQVKIGNRNKTAHPVSRNTVEQGQPDRKPDQKLQEKRNGGDSKSDSMKTSRFSNVFGCWRDELIVVSLVMTIVTLVFLLFVCFHYERKIDNRNIDYEKKIDHMIIELVRFKYEFTKIRVEFKKPNPALGTTTCLQNDDIQKDLNTKLDTITSNATTMNDTIKILGDAISTDIQNIATVLTETISLVWENETRLSKEISSLNISFDLFQTNTTQQYDNLKLSVDALNETIERNILEKVKSFDHHLEILQVVERIISEKVKTIDDHLDILHSATENADHIISQLEKDVDKIFPNTFNKGALIAAFMLLVLIVLLCAAALYRLYYKLETCQQDIARLKGLEVQYTEWLKADNSNVVSNTDKLGIKSTINTDTGEAPAGCEVDGLTPRTTQQDE